MREAAGQAAPVLTGAPASVLDVLAGPVSVSGFLIDYEPAVDGFLGSYGTGGGVSPRS